MATLKITVPQASQNIEGVVTIKAPLEKVFEAYVALERADFVAVDPQTTEIRTLSTFQSREDRDGMVSSGMEAGWRQSVEALGRLIEE